MGFFLLLLFFKFLFCKTESQNNLGAWDIQTSVNLTSTLKSTTNLDQVVLEKKSHILSQAHVSLQGTLFFSLQKAVEDNNAESLTASEKRIYLTAARKLSVSTTKSTYNLIY